MKKVIHLTGKALFGFVALIFYPSCSSESTSGIDARHSGFPNPIRFESSKGKCDKVWVSERDATMAGANCGVTPAGRGRISVFCPDASLPAAFIEREFAPGSSDGVLFNNVCSSTAEQIRKGNEKRDESGYWNPG
jgi:hypothetical protein